MIINHVVQWAGGRRHNTMRLTRHRTRRPQPNNICL